MLMLITLLNDGTLISIGYDNVKPSSMPEKWNLPVSRGLGVHPTGVQQRGLGLGACCIIALGLSGPKVAFLQQLALHKQADDPFPLALSEALLACPAA